MPISQNTYTVPNNFVQQYDLGQKKIRADLVDENFTDAAGAINTLLTDDANTVHKTGAETISGNKTFTGTNAFGANTTGVTATAGDNSTKFATTAYTDAAVSAIVPVGSIIWSGKSSAPTGYLLCNGSAVGRATYPELFSAIGTAFGSGDGSTTFNLPNLIDKFIEGSNAAGTVKAAGLPNLGGCIDIIYSGIHAYDTFLPAGTSNAFYNTEGNKSKYVVNPGNTNAFGSLVFDASLSNSIYGNSITVQPPAVTALPCIKY